MLNFEKEKLIQEINVLGPWVHGYFDLGNGIIIEDQDLLQKKRLFAMRDYFIDIIAKFYKKNEIRNKSLCDVGCNTGYFLYELYRKFNFKHVVGVEPRTKNLEKAKFIADFFELPKKRFSLKKFDILTYRKKLPMYDVVIMPGVLHHLDDHVLALRNLYKMTKELCIIETLVLSDDFNTQDISGQLELKDNLYKLKENEIITTIIPNSTDFIVIYFAALILSLRIVPIDPEKGEKEIEEIINFIKPKIVIIEKREQKSTYNTLEIKNIDLNQLRKQKITFQFYTILTSNVIF